MNGKSFQSALGFVSGVLIGLSIITPVLGATSPAMEPWNGVLTVIALVLLAVGFGLYATQASERSSSECHRARPWNNQGVATPESRGDDRGFFSALVGRNRQQPCIASRCGRVHRHRVLDDEARRVVLALCIGCDDRDDPAFARRDLAAQRGRTLP